jgi:hypothetical protein
LSAGRKSDSAEIEILEALMTRKNHLEHARVTAICVNLALDCVEADIRQELGRISGEGSTALKRVLVKLKERRVTGNELEATGTC